MPEGLSATEVGKEIAEHKKQHVDEHARRERAISIAEAVILSIVAVIAAWSGYSAAKWGTEASIHLAQASSTRAKANRAASEALQIRTLDSVSFNAVVSAYTAHDRRVLRIATARLRPGYRPAFKAWSATHPLTNPHAPPGPAYMPQYKIPEEAQARALDAQADSHFAEGESAGSTSDKYVRITVYLATVLFLVGIGSHFPLRGSRYAMIGVASVLILVSVGQLLTLPGLP
jgi:hypothetical protein